MFSLNYLVFPARTVVFLVGCLTIQTVVEAVLARPPLKNYKALSLDVLSKMLSLKDARDRWDGVFKNANWDGVAEVYYNRYILVSL